MSALTVVTLFGLLAGFAWGSRFALVAQKVTAFASDGARFVVWEDSDHTLTILDVRSNGRRTLQAPSGCELEAYGESPLSSNGRFLITCDHSGTAVNPQLTQYLLNATTGVLSRMPVGYQWDWVGSHYVAGYVGDPGFQECFPRPSKPCNVLLNLETRKVTRYRTSTPVDVDTPTAQVCPALTAAFDTEALAGDYSDYRTLTATTFATEYGHHGALQINDCDGLHTVLPGPRRTWVTST